MAELTHAVRRTGPVARPTIIRRRAPVSLPAPEDPVQAPLTAAGDAARGSDDGEASRHEDRHP